MPIEGSNDKSISNDLVYELITCISLKKTFRDKVPYNVISSTISSLLEQSIKSITAENIIECYTSTPVLDSHAIVEQKSISKELTTKKKEELANIIKWLMPWIKQSSSKKNSVTSSVFLISMGPGQGKTILIDALYKAIKNISSDKLKQHTRNIVKTSFSTDLDAQNLDLSSFSPGTIVLLDGLTKSQTVISVENVTYIIFTDSKNTQKIKSLFPQNMVYTLEIEEMDIGQTMELIEKRFIVEPIIRPKLYKTVQKLLEVHLSPKKILSIIDYASRLDNELTRSTGFSFNQNTVEYVAAHAGVNFGYDFDLTTLENSLKQRIYGQDHAINLVVEAVGIAKYGMRRKTKPLLTAIFGGATGIGKTELASSLSTYLFGENSLLRIDMGEYTEHHSVARLIGSPPGYIGYTTDTAFATALKKTTRRVILFDEIEKAAPDIHQLLLGIMDNGKLTLSNGEVLDLRESVIILTTNALADKAGRFQLGFHEKGIQKDMLANYREELLKSKIFSYEFLNRLDAIIPFNVLTQSAAEKIAIREIDTIHEEIQYHGYTLTYTPEAFSNLIKNADKTQGGRGILRGIDAWKRQIVSKIRKGEILVKDSKKTIHIEESYVY